MRSVTKSDIKNIYIPPDSSHKGQNGRLLVIGGSHLFHAASLWALKVASRIVDLVHYSSVPENNELVMRLKAEFRDGIVVSRCDVESYIAEDDCILIGPGMVRKNNSKLQFKIQNLRELDKIKDEGLQTESLTNYLLTKYPDKQWVIDAGALQTLDINLIPKNAILTPHQGEFESLWSRMQETDFKIPNETEIPIVDRIKLLAQHCQCIVLVKGKVDVVCNGGECDGRICVPGECREIHGGNSGMTKGGTGDVLAGLIAALATKNDPFLATIAGSYINKIAGDALYKKVGPFFNASDLADEIPKVLKKVLIHYK